jgi:hypothetical protein
MDINGRSSPEKGSAMVASVVFAISVMALTASVISGGLALRQEAKAHDALRGAQQAAESGIHLVVAKMSGTEGPALLAAGRTEGVLRGSGRSAARYAVTLRSGAADLLDNDLDGVVDEQDESETIEAVSTGSFGGVTRTVYVTLLARYRSPAIQSATYISNPAAPFDVDGAAFLISGRDVNLAGEETGALVAGIGVNGDPSLVHAAIQANQVANVVGVGPNPSVLEVPELDLQGLIEDGARTASLRIEDGTMTNGSGPEWGTIDSPAVVYASGSLRISGGAGGAGLLLVNGDLTITGGYSWHGVIMVRGRVVFKGGGGQKRLIGALVVENDVVSEEDEGGAQIAGNIDIVFSSETVERLARVFSRYTVLNWREGPVSESEVVS